MYGNVCIKLLDDGSVVRMKGEKDLESLFHRLNNSFIRRLALSFLPEDLPAPYYLQANADNEEIDGALVDFLGVHLKPQTYEASTGVFADLAKDYAMLFTRNALRGNIKHLVYSLCEAPAPDCIFPELFGINVVETCALSTYDDLCPWIGKFIKIFDTAERGTEIVRAVTLITDYAYESPHHAVGALGQPRRTDAAAPHNAFVKEWLSSIDFGGITLTESSVAELFVFENAQAAKKLEVLVWTIAESLEGRPTGYNYVFLLQVFDV
ncbi:hypothetical protein AAVH_16292 [Aphelenchoides avenae]|nr:hypothetical protein AAVH_16292 [Aphelenchus avenae]